MNFWSDIFNSSCKGNKNVLYILYYNTTNIKWTNKITNDELWRITKQKPIEIQIKKNKMELDRTHIM
jgi:hypothetical protein